MGFLLVTSVQTDVFSTWKKITQLPPGTSGTAGFFFNRLEGFIGLRTPGPNRGPGPVLYTRNGGITWSVANTPAIDSSVYVTDIWFSDANEGWITYNTARSGGLWYTSNRGITWSKQPVTGLLTSVRKTPSAVVATEYLGGGLRVSEDGGWTFRQLPTRGQNGVAFSDALHGIASGYGTPTLYTSDGGITWKSTDTLYNESWGAYAVPGSPLCFIIPEIGTSGLGPFRSPVHRSTDYGVHWSIVDTLPVKTTGAISGKGTTLFVQTDQSDPSGAGLWRSTDLGTSWQSIDGPAGLYDTRFVVLDSSTIIAFSLEGGVYRTDNGGDGTGTSVLTFNHDTTLSLTASLCDTTQLRLFIKNFNDASDTLQSIYVTDSLRDPSVKQAFGIDSMPSLVHAYAVGRDSVSILLGWRPRKLFNRSGLDSSLITVLTKRLWGYIDTLRVKVYLRAATPPLHLALASVPLRYDGVMDCVRDTTVTLSNPNCDTLTINRLALLVGSVWELTPLDGRPLKLPLVLAPGESVDFRLRFTPVDLSGARDTIQLAVSFFGKDTSAKYALFGQAKTYDPLTAAADIDLGKVSMCSNASKDLIIANDACYALTLSEIRLNASEWLILDSLGAPPKLPVVIEPHTVLRLRCLLNPTSKGSKFTIADLRFRQFGNEFGHSLQLNGEAVSAISQLAGIPTTTSLSFPDRTECEAAQSITFSLKDPGCDSVWITDVLVTGTGAPFLCTTSSPLPYVLGSNDSLAVTVTASLLDPGVYSGTLRFHYKLSDGSEHDTAVDLTYTINRVKRELAWRSTPMHFGTLTACDDRDSVVVFSNPGCKAITVTAESLQGNEILLRAGHTLPFTLQPGESDTLHLVTAVTHSGVLNGTLRVESTADNGGVYTLDLDGYVSPIDSVQFQLTLSKDPVMSDERLVVSITPDRVLSNKSVHSLEGDLEYYSDAFRFLSQSSSTPYNLTSSNPVRYGNYDRVHFRIDGENMSFDPSQPILAIALKRLIADSVDAPIALTSLMLNGDQQQFATCGVVSTFTSTVSHLEPHCAEGLLMRKLQGVPMLKVSHPLPNPVIGTNGVSSKIRLTAAADMRVIILLYDADGKRIDRAERDLKAGIETVHHFQLGSGEFASGVYRYTIESAAHDSEVLHGSIVLQR